MIRSFAAVVVTPHPYLHLYICIRRIFCKRLAAGVQHNRSALVVNVGFIVRVNRFIAVTFELFVFAPVLL